MMKIKLLFALPLLLAGTASANSLAPTGDALPPAQEETAPPLPDSASERLRSEYHNPLHGILSCVYDKTSADAAAPRVKALMASPEGANLNPAPEIWLFLYFGHNCFGSAELQDALRKLLPENFDSAEKLRSLAQPFMDELSAHLHSLAECVEQVNDADSEARAAEKLNALPTFMEDWCKRADEAVSKGLEGGTSHRDDVYFHMAIVQVQPLPAIDSLRHAYGHACARNKSGFPALTAAVQRASEPLVQLTGNPFSAVNSPEALAEAERQASAFREWLAVAAGVTDKASAEAAADWLETKNAELGFSLMRAAGAAMEEGCCCTLSLAITMEFADSYLRWATPSFFGSKRLENLLDEAEEAQAMKPTPVNPRPAEEENSASE